MIQTVKITKLETQKQSNLRQGASNHLLQSLVINMKSGGRRGGGGGGVEGHKFVNI